MQRKPQCSWDDVSQNWTSYRGAVRRRWSKLKHEDMEQIQGNRGVLVATIQKRYGATEEEASRQIDEWLEILEC